MVNAYLKISGFFSLRVSFSCGLTQKVASKKEVAPMVYRKEY